MSLAAIVEVNEDFGLTLRQIPRKKWHRQCYDGRGEVENHRSRGSFPSVRDSELTHMSIVPGLLHILASLRNFTFFCSVLLHRQHRLSCAPLFQHPLIIAPLCAVVDAAPGGHGWPNSVPMTRDLKTIINLSTQCSFTTGQLAQLLSTVFVLMYLGCI